MNARRNWGYADIQPFWEGRHWHADVLQVSDERYQRVQVELKHTVEILHEEQERIVKIEAIKKSLEIEVKNLSVRLEEVEANAIVGGKRVISKLEARVGSPRIQTSSSAY